MKKIIVFILAVTYFGLSTGATVHMHYCMGKLVGSSLWHNDKTDKCSKCGMEKNTSKNKCCKDENKLVKIEKDQTLTQTVYQFTPADFIFEKTNFFEISFISFTEAAKDNTCINAPPRSLKVATYISNCIFRI